jgi:predicted membrane protein
MEIEMIDERRSGAKILIGLLLVIIGTFALLGSLDILDFRISRIIFSIPFVLLVIGLIILANSTKKVFGGVLAAIGIFFLIPKIFPVQYDASIIFPVIIITLGIYILLRAKEKHDYKIKADSKGDSREFIDEVAVFGGGNRIISSDSFKGGSITAIFGGAEINLAGSKLAEGDNVLEVVTIFGGTEIIVPRDWDVKLNVTPIFGGFSNKMVKEFNAPVDQTRRLIVKGVAIFGGGDIKSY